jgi:hypothetical protein
MKIGKFTILIMGYWRFKPDFYSVTVDGITRHYLHILKINITWFGKYCQADHIRQKIKELNKSLIKEGH